MRPRYTELLCKSLNQDSLVSNEIEYLLTPYSQDEREALYKSAQIMREQYSGNLIYTYGFVYLSTICRNDCLFCAWRRSNPNSVRYRKTNAEIVSAAQTLVDQGVNLIDLTMGEDPDVDKRSYLESTAELIFDVRKRTGVPVMISPGLVPSYGLALFREAGALWYACYQETHSPFLFAQLRSGQSYENRWQAKLEAKKTGLLVEEGVLCGVGESAKDLANSILAMKELAAPQVRAMAFVPPPSSPKWMPEKPSELARQRELDMIAVLRLSFPHTLIPASLDVEGLSGLSDRLTAGANLITSFVPSDKGLAGVAQNDLDIGNEGRSVQAVLPILEEMGLTQATNADYLEKVMAYA